MSLIESVYLIASAAGVDALVSAVAALSDVGIHASSSADYSTPAGIFSAIAASHVVVHIDGWESSPGAVAEAGIAAALGKPVLPLADLLSHAA